MKSLKILIGGVCACLISSAKSPRKCAATGASRWKPSSSSLQRHWHFQLGPTPVYTISIADSSLMIEGLS